MGIVRKIYNGLFPSKSAPTLPKEKPPSTPKRGHLGIVVSSLPKPRQPKIFHKTRSEPPKYHHLPIKIPRHAKSSQPNTAKSSRPNGGLWQPHPLRNSSSFQTPPPSPQCSPRELWDEDLTNSLHNQLDIMKKIPGGEAEWIRNRIDNYYNPTQAHRKNQKWIDRFSYFLESSSPMRFFQDRIRKAGHKMAIEDLTDLVNGRKENIPSKSQQIAKHVLASLHNDINTLVLWDEMATQKTRWLQEKIFPSLPTEEQQRITETASYNSHPYKLYIHITDEATAKIYLINREVFALNKYGSLIERLHNIIDRSLMRASILPGFMIMHIKAEYLYNGLYDYRIYSLLNELYWLIFDSRSITNSHWLKKYPQYIKKTKKRTKITERTYLEIYALQSKEKEQEALEYFKTLFIAFLEHTNRNYIQNLLGIDVNTLEDPYDYVRAILKIANCQELQIKETPGGEKFLQRYPWAISENRLFKQYEWLKSNNDFEKCRIRLSSIFPEISPEDIGAIKQALIKENIDLLLASTINSQWEDIVLQIYKNWYEQIPPIELFKSHKHPCANPYHKEDSDYFYFWEIKAWLHYLSLDLSLLPIGEMMENELKESHHINFIQWIIETIIEKHTITTQLQQEYSNTTKTIEELSDEFIQQNLPLELIEENFSDKPHMLNAVDMAYKKLLQEILIIDNKKGFEEYRCPTQSSNKSNVRFLFSHQKEFLEQTKEGQEIIQNHLHNLFEYSSLECYRWNQVFLNNEFFPRHATIVFFEAIQSLIEKQKEEIHQQIQSIFQLHGIELNLNTFTEEQINLCKQTRDWEEYIPPEIKARYEAISVISRSSPSESELTFKNYFSHADTISSWLEVEEVRLTLGYSGLITTLDLRKRNLHIIPPEIALLHELLNLNISYNEISEISKYLLDCSQLSSLDASRNYINRFAQEYDEAEKPLPELENLQLSNNFLDHIPVFNVVQLHLHHNKFQNFPQFPSSPKIRWLDLCHNEIRQNPADIKQFKQVSPYGITLLLLGNPVCNADPESLKRVIHKSHSNTDVRFSNEEIPELPTKRH